MYLLKFYNTFKLLFLQGRLYGYYTRLLYGYHGRSVKDFILKICVLETVVLKVTQHLYRSARKSKTFSLLLGNEYFYCQSN